MGSVSSPCYRKVEALSEGLFGESNVSSFSSGSLGVNWRLALGDVSITIRPSRYLKEGATMCRG